jgi:caa(3)-type oxidase subunit IV
MSEHAQSDSHEKLYWMVGAALFGLTVATVLVSKYHIPAPWGLIVGLAIAALKAGLVASVFMHLKWESKYIYYFLGLTVAATFFLFALPIVDARWTHGHIVEKADPAAASAAAAHH